MGVGRGSTDGMEWGGRRGRLTESRYLVTRTGHLAEFTVFPLRRVNWHLALLVPPQGTSDVARPTAIAAAPTTTSASLLARLRLAVVGSDGIQRLVKTCRDSRQPALFHFIQHNWKRKLKIGETGKKAKLESNWEMCAVKTSNGWQAGQSGH